VNRFRERFKQRHVVLPVVHVASTRQALWNVMVARDAGADGVFLINHSISDNTLLHIHHEVLDAFPGFWVGVNCLGLSVTKLFEVVSPDVAGVWVDNAAIQEDREEHDLAEQVLAVQQQTKWPGLYFGGVAFKYQRAVTDLASAARIAARYMDVVTTSGSSTGHAALREKIVAMKQALDDFPLAIASGITPENVGDYLDIADCFLVATGISRSFEELDPGLLDALLQKVRNADDADRERA